MDLPRDIFGIVKLFLTPLNKLALSHTCRKYRQMFGTLKSIINDHCYDIGFISRFMHHATYKYDIDYISYTSTAHNTTVIADSIFSLINFSNSKFIETCEVNLPIVREFDDDFWLCFESQGYKIDLNNLFYNGVRIADAPLIGGDIAVVFSCHIFIIYESVIEIYDQFGNAKIIEKHSRRPQYFLSENMLIIDSIMFHKNGYMYKTNTLITICDYIMWHDEEKIYVRYIQ